MNRISLANSLRNHVRRAFTLIELMVVVGIILLLAALTIGVATALSAGSDVRQTQDVIKLLEAAYDEWAQTSQRQITFGPDPSSIPLPPGAPLPVYDLHENDFPLGSDEEDELLSEVLRIIARNSNAAAMLQRIDSKFLKRVSHPGGESHLHLYDPWDNEIRVVFPGRLWVTGDAADRRDRDGTFRTDYELRYGVCSNRRLMFISAGPDGNFGNLHLNVAMNSLNAQQRANMDFAADNIVSYSPDKERP